MRVVLLLEALLAGGLQVVATNSDDIVTAVGGRVIDRLVLAHQEEGDGGSKPAEAARIGADVDMVPGPRVGETGLYQFKELALSELRPDGRIQSMCCNVDMSSQIGTAEQIDIDNGTSKEHCWELITFPTVCDMVTVLSINQD